MAAVAAAQGYISMASSVVTSAANPIMRQLLSSGATVVITNEEVNGTNITSYEW
jgi:hypothetical protein